MHPDPEIREQMERDRLDRLGAGRIVKPWTRDWHFWKYIVGAVGGISVWILVGVFNGGQAVQRTRNKTERDSMANAIVHDSLRYSIRENTNLTRSLIVRMDSIYDEQRSRTTDIYNRQQIVLAILCEGVESNDIRRSCRAAGFPPRIP